MSDRDHEQKVRSQEEYLNWLNGQIAGINLSLQLFFYLNLSDEAGKSFNEVLLKAKSQIEKREFEPDLVEDYVQGTLRTLKVLTTPVDPSARVDDPNWPDIDQTDFKGPEAA
ncbi:MAG: hypothetical protein OXJ55_01990 [Caldilineaceae bacterium]|nr:hypothetical protein [Caldilineaceae bacterium]